MCTDNVNGIPDVASHPLPAHYARYMATIENFTMMSDTFMRSVFKNVECAEYVIRIITGRRNLQITSVVVQQDHKNLHGHSAILDCVAQDAVGRRFCIEVQQRDSDASPKRSRYYSSILDANTLNPGEEYDDLPESYVIFITATDVLGSGLSLYHIERSVSETMDSFDDQSHIIYVNAGVQDDTELGKLMHDFHCRKASDMYSPILAKRMRELKETQKGIEEMCVEMETLCNEARMEEKREIARSLSDMGMSVGNIARIVHAEISQVSEWLAEKI